MIPRQLRKFPLWNGYPVHFTVLVKDGIPDFRAINQANQMQAIENKLCHLCGEPMFDPYFISDQELPRHVLTDGPMHYDCADFACSLCPYLKSHPVAIYRPQQWIWIGRNPVLFVANRLSPVKKEVL